MFKNIFYFLLKRKKTVHDFHSKLTEKRQKKSLNNLASVGQQPGGSCSIVLHCLTVCRAMKCKQWKNVVVDVEVVWVGPAWTVFPHSEESERASEREIDELRNKIENSHSTGVESKIYDLPVLKINDAIKWTQMNEQVENWFFTALKISEWGRVEFDYLLNHKWKKKSTSVAFELIESRLSAAL